LGFLAGGVVRLGVAVITQLNSLVNCKTF
jgi:hypothetical protein